LTPRSLAVCADDFGMHQDVDGAILDLVAQRRVTTVSCMVGGASWRQQGPRLAARPREALETGLHFDLTLSPLGPVRAQPLPLLIGKAFARALSLSALREQVERQLDAFEQVMQRAPDHVDGHQHVHQLPGVREALLGTLLRRYPGKLPWLRSTRPAPRATLKAYIIDALGGAQLRRAAARAAFDTSARLLGVHDFRTDAAGYAELLSGCLRDCRDGDVLMCHPGWSPGAATDPLRAMRVTEWRVLSGDAFGQLMARERVTLRPLGQARGGGSSSPKQSVKPNHRET
jgi:predicted glycoside hydrolase/deacetylase ChbG (UPF0249 family)